MLFRLKQEIIPKPILKLKRSGKRKNSIAKTPVYEWTVSDVQVWLSSLPNGGQYISKFLEQKVNGRVLLTLNQEKLKQWDVEDSELVKEIERLATLGRYVPSMTRVKRKRSSAILLSRERVSELIY